MLASEVTDSSLYRLLKNRSKCFESLVLRQAQQNGKSSMIANFPFVLSSSKDS
jgi:hypothetical protein